MIGLGITAPTAGITVGRNVTIRGYKSQFKGSLSSMSLSFGAGSSLIAMNTPTPTATSWTWTGEIPANIRPGQAFRATVTARGYVDQTPRGASEPVHTNFTETVGVDLILEYIVPQLTIADFQPIIVTYDPTLPFTLRGTLSETNSSVYQPALTCQINNNATTLVYPTNGAWSMPLDLAPGVYKFTLRAYDHFGSEDVQIRMLTVLCFPKPADDPSLPHTAAGIPTTGSITSWTRIEPQVSQADMGASSSARVFDPLWLLTRQWQVGEFQAEDTGSPVQARVRATSARLSRCHLGEVSPTNLAGAPYDPGKAPLETMIERRPMRARDAGDIRMLPLAVDAGLLFLRMLEPNTTTAKYRAAFLTKYAMQPLSPTAAAAIGSDAARFVQTMAGRAPDARLLAAAFRVAQPIAFDASLGIAAGDVAAVSAVAVAWLAKYDGLFTEPPSADDAWNPPRLEYAASVATRFSAAAQDGVTLSATEFDGGRLDWSSFDINTTFEIDTTGDTPFTTMAEMTVPAPVTFHGSPAPRFWEMEDAKVAYGLLTAGPTDLAQLMMIEYASSYGNDWYIVPMTLPVGTVTRIDSLVVTDTFGVRNLLSPMGDPSLPPAYFSMWQQSAVRYAGATSEPPVSNAFFLPPTIVRSIDGPPLEDVLFMRDEMANLAWGIERTVEGPVETSVSLATGPASTAIAAPPEPGAPPKYTLSTTVPQNWVPLIPVRMDDKGTVRLKRGAVSAEQPSYARSNVLNASTDKMFYDEEIPREGVRITRRRRMTRWTDGSTWVWTGYRNDVGRGEGSAGLRFDQIEEGNPG